MKSQHDHMEGRYYFECHCGTPDHLLQVELEDEEADPIITFYFISNYNAPWYTRVKNAFKYIFFKQYYGLGDCVAFSERNLEALEEMVGVIKEFKHKPSQADVITDLLEQAKNKPVYKRCPNCGGYGVLEAADWDEFHYKECNGTGKII